MFFLGFSAGLPLLLIFSSLSLWLREAGVDRSTVTFFSWAALGYSFKFVWAPLVDVLPLPVLTRSFGRRRGWLLLSQSMIIISIIAMSMTNPSGGASTLTMMAFAAVALGFSSATQDIVIDAYRIESAPDSLQAALSASYIAGYRVALIAAGAGALFIAERLGSSMESYSYEAWRWAYIIMALMMMVGIITTLLRPEPMVNRSNNHRYESQHYLRFFLLFCLMAAGFILTFIASRDIVDTLVSPDGLGETALTKVLVGGGRLALAFLVSGSIAFFGILTHFVDRPMVVRSYIYPVKNFFDRYDTKAALLLLALIGTYRISDIILGVIANVFYQDLGFSKQQIATVVKTYGLGMTLIGGLLGGILVKQIGLMRMLFWGAILSAGTNLLFMSLAGMGHNMPMLYLVISADNLAAGLATAAFVAFLSSLTDISFTAIQYAIFSSLMTLLPKTLGGYSGSMVTAMGYENFFLTTALIGVPVLWVVWRCGHLTEEKAKTSLAH
jgi:PAT family beta-lactamase induction signal transducer AmpG